MKRWNGWGSESVEVPLSSAATAYLSDAIGLAQPGPSANFDAIVHRIPHSRLSDHPLIQKDAGLRLRYARGQSLPDWIALRFGTISRFPDAVARPSSEEEVQQVIRFSRETGTRLIPYGGGTSVVGHINPPDDEGPVLTVSLERMRQMSELDKTSLLATFGAGVTGPHLEAQLRAHGYTLGHFPQSFEYSTLGGWIATHSSGQQSLYYGRIEDLFAGGRIVTPLGMIDFPPFPATAAGPDLRHIVLGSEGRLGIITHAVMRISPLPQSESFHAAFFPDWISGMDAVREMAQSKLPLSMLRLSDRAETATTLVLAGRERLVNLLHRLLRARGLGDEKCLLFFGTTGSRDALKKVRRSALEVARDHGGVYVGRNMGNEWRKSRFSTPYLRNTLWEKGYAVDTLETAFSWKELPGATAVLLDALRSGLDDAEERVLSFVHISHVYPTGASIYVTYLFRVAKTAEETQERWKRLKETASQIIVDHGGTISHQHGVGLDHLAWLPGEKGELGIHAVEALIRNFDPYGIMNPGKLVLTALKK